MLIAKSETENLISVKKRENSLVRQNLILFLYILWLLATNIIMLFFFALPHERKFSFSESIFFRIWILDSIQN